MAQTVDDSHTFELAYDARTRPGRAYVLLGERTVQVEKRTGEDGLITPGAVTFTGAVIAQAVAGGMKQTP